MYLNAKNGEIIAKGSALISATWISLLRYHTIPKKRVHLGNTSIYRSQQGVISDSPNTLFETVGEVSRFSFFITSKFGRTPDTAQTLHRHLN